MDHDLAIERAGAERIGELEPLWAALQRHHAELQPEIGGAPALPEGLSWARRRAAYLEWLAAPEAFLLVAARAERLVGYSVVRLEVGWAGWDTGERLGVVETLAVLPDERGKGVGTALMDEAERRLAELDVLFVEVSATPANESAIRFYERRGLERAAIKFAGPIRRPPDEGSEEGS